MIANQYNNPCKRPTLSDIYKQMCGNKIRENLRKGAQDSSKLNFSGKDVSSNDGM